MSSPPHIRFACEGWKPLPPPVLPARPDGALAGGDGPALLRGGLHRDVRHVQAVRGDPRAPCSNPLPAQVDLDLELVWCDQQKGGQTGGAEAYSCAKTAQASPISLVWLEFRCTCPPPQSSGVWPLSLDLEPPPSLHASAEYQMLRGTIVVFTRIPGRLSAAVGCSWDPWRALATPSPCSNPLPAPGVSSWSLSEEERGKKRMGGRSATLCRRTRPTNAAGDAKSIEPGRMNQSDASTSSGMPEAGGRPGPGAGGWRAPDAEIPAGA